MCTFTSFSYPFLSFLARIFNIVMNQCGESRPNCIVPNLRGKWKVIVKAKVTQSYSNSLWPHGLYSPWNSLGQNAGVGSLSLLQGIFPTQGSNPGLLHCRQSLYQLSHQGNPRILEGVAYPFSSRSSWPRDQTRVSCIAGGFFTNWAIREAILDVQNLLKVLVEGFCRCFLLTCYSSPCFSFFWELVSWMCIALCQILSL